jgi:hypothetical protein
MAKRSSNGKVNKSQEIRDLVAENRRISTEEIVSTLAGKGIEVQPSLIYLVRGKMRRKRRKLARQQSAAKAATNPVVLITKVRDLATQVGGMSHLKQLVEALAE